MTEKKSRTNLTLAGVPYTGHRETDEVLNQVPDILERVEAARNGTAVGTPLEQVISEIAGMSGSMNDPQALATEIRRVNAANGWGGDYGESAVLGYLCLIHTEVTEAAHEDTPEGRNGELADVLVRALDLMEHIKPGAVQRRLSADFATTVTLPAWALPIKDAPAALLHLHALIDAAAEAFRKVTPWEPAVLDALAAVCGYTAAIVPLDLPERDRYRPDLVRTLVDGKVQANRQRGYRHGGRRA